jgi:hypothetical protein
MENLENVKPLKRYLNDEFLELRASENYYSLSYPFSGLFMTDGLKYVTDKLGLQWFIDTVL